MGEGLLHGEDLLQQGRGCHIRRGLIQCKIWSVSKVRGKVFPLGRSTQGAGLDGS